jgi:hypothetical protein
LTFKPYATTDIKTVLQRKSWKLKWLSCILPN